MHGVGDLSRFFYDRNGRIANMPKIVDKVEITIDELKAHKLQVAGLTIAKIAKKMKKSDTSVNRYLKSYKIKTKSQELDNSEAVWLTDLVEQSKLGIKKLLESTETPAHVKANLYLKILSSEGLIVEKSEIKHKGKLPIELDISERLDARISDLANAIGGKSNGKQ